MPAARAARWTAVLRRLWAAHSRRAQRSAAARAGGAQVRHHAPVPDGPELDSLAAVGPAADSAVLRAAPTPEHRRWLRAAGATGAPDGTVAAFAQHIAPMDARRLARALDPLAQPRGLLRQQSPTTCGSAALVVARMLADPVYALRVLDGYDAAAGESLDGDVSRRFAAEEQAVKRRTNGVRGRRGPGVPWPRALGTPPWGACREMDGPAGRPGSRYRVLPVDSDSVPERTRAYAVVAGAAASGHPVPLYVGDAALPRHVVLVVGVSAASVGGGASAASEGGGGALTVFDPARGDVTRLTAAAFRSGDLALSGWPRPWAAVLPR